MNISTHCCKLTFKGDIKVVRRLTSILFGIFRQLISRTRTLVGLAAVMHPSPGFFTPLTTDHVSAQSASTPKVLAQISPSTISCALVNGDRVSGTVLSTSSCSISISTEYFGDVTVHRKAITSCHTKDSVLAQKISGFISSSPTEAGSLNSPAVPLTPPTSNRPNQSEVKAQAGVAQDLKTKIVPMKTTPKGPWKRTFEFNYAFAHGNSNISDLNLNGGIEYRERENRLRVYSLFRRGKSDGQDSANLFTASARYDRTIKTEFFAFAATSYFAEVSYERDILKKLDHRIAWNGGLSMPLLKDTKDLALDVGGGVTREIHSTGLTRTLGSGLIRLTDERLIFRQVRVKEAFAIFPDFADPGRYRLHADLSLRAPLTKHISLQIGTRNRFDSKPQDLVRRNDVSILSGLVVEF